MTGKTIEIVIAPDGAVRMETRGFAGQECRAASAFLEAALGAKLNDQPTAEAFATAEKRATTEIRSR